MTIITQRLTSVSTRPWRLYRIVRGAGISRVTAEVARLQYSPRGISDLTTPGRLVGINPALVGRE